MRIPFNKPFLTNNELKFIQQAHENRHLSGDGPFTKRCEEWLGKVVGSSRVLLTHSCTGALEMAAILADVGPGDEVILPSYTFPSTANAFALRGARLVFVDIRPDTLNIDETKLEKAITKRAKVVVPVHYAGIACEMDAVLAVARSRRLLVVEDAAQGLMASYKNRPLGSMGHFGAFSFHETKNIMSGEGGALAVNDAKYLERAEIIRQKGTNRREFLLGRVDKYTWVDIGSSFPPSDITAAFLWAQMERAQAITDSRLRLWRSYHAACAALEALAILRRPFVPDDCRHNAHMYYILVRSASERKAVLAECRRRGIGAIFHYVPLHSSPAGKKYGRCGGRMDVTEDVSRRVLRLPLWVGMPERMLQAVVAALTEILGEGAVVAPSRGVARGRIDPRVSVA